MTNLIYFPLNWLIFFNGTTRQSEFDGIGYCSRNVLCQPLSAAGENSDHLADLGPATFPLDISGCDAISLTPTGLPALCWADPPGACASTVWPSPTPVQTWAWMWKSISRVWLWPRVLHTPWNSLGQSIGVSGLSLLQGIFPTWGWNSGLLHCRQILYQLIHQGSPRILEWVSFPFARGSSWPRN